MSSKTIYVLTFLSYALIHSVRTGWSYMKTYMQHEPFSFSTQFLGEIDLVILISLAISLKTIGWIGEKIGYKLFLLLGMGYLSVLSIIVSTLIINGITVHWAYIFLLCMTGISMCTGWPSCLSIVSKFYSPIENSFLICIWNGCSQFGDLIAVFLGYIVIQWGGATQGYLLLTIGLMILVMLIINWIFLIPAPSSTQISSNNSNNIENKQSGNNSCKNSSNKQNSLNDRENDQNKSQKSESGSGYSQQISSQNNIQNAQSAQQVNFLNVWCLPSVASYVCCYSCLKAINSIIMNWLFMYLFSIGLHKLSGLITLSWSISIFVGNLLMGYYNKTTSKIGMMIPLVFTGFVFAYLGFQYQRSGSANYLILLILSGICFGGPFGIIGSRVALILGQHPQIKPKKNALGAIISLMQGFGQFISAFFVLIIPYIGLRKLFYLPTLLCLIASAILLYEHKKGSKFYRRQNIRKRELQLKDFS